MTTDRDARQYDRYPKGVSPKAQVEAFAEALIEYEHDPFGFVMWALPWGVEGTELADETGPDEWQIEELEAIGQHLRQGIDKPFRSTTASGHGIGKAQPHDLVIDTPHGPMRWGDLKPGDRVFGVSGEPTVISAVHRRGVLPTYKVRLDDGGETLVCGDHLWTVRGRQQRRYGGTESVTLSTQQIIDLGVKRPNGVAHARQWELPRQGALQMPEAALPVHPYTLGVWLGDGGRNSARITSRDMGVIRRLEAVGETVTQHVGLAWGIKGLAAGLRTLGVLERYSYEKSVPAWYMHASAEQRAEVLRGLLDTDGECNKAGSIIFGSTSERLARDVVWLARSLGGKARMQPTRQMPHYPGPDGERKAGRPCWRVTLSMPDGFRAFYIDRKQSRIKPVEARYLSRWIDAIEPAGEAECSCITVEAEDHLYLTSDLIPTHNSAETSFVILWSLMTAVDTKGIVTANSDTQLRTKTWAELAKWWSLLCHQHPIAKTLFEVTATGFRSLQREMTWRIDAIPNNPRNPAAFAGAHNAGKRLVIIIDEASEIEDIIWDVVEGALTDADTEIILLVYGNPTKNVGRFKEITAGRMRHAWRTKQIDSRKVKRTNKAVIQSWVDAWGEDSDFVRIRVRGVFPRVGSMQLIPSDLVQAARNREPVYIPSDPLVAGLDVARFGDDASVLRARRGRDAVSFPKKEWRNIDLMTLASDVALWCRENKPDALFVDIGGLGAGVYDRLQQLRVPNVFPINFGGRARTAYMNGVEARVADHGAAMWVNLLAWLPLAALPPDDDQIEIDLTSREYGFTADGAIRLESKKDMKKRGLASPDDADALALTFAMPVQPRRVASSASDLAAVLTGSMGDVVGIQTDYDPYAELR